MTHKINIGLLGLGNIACGLIDLLAKNNALVLQKTGIQFVITKAVVRDLGKTRPNLVSHISLSDKLNFITEDPEIDIVIELTDNVEVAFQSFLQSMEAKKGFITANKALVAQKGLEFWDLFQKNKEVVGIEASSGGAIPLVRTIDENFGLDEIQHVTAIINGTANYILSTMLKENLSFETALKTAIEKGYAESDPTHDIDGSDVAHKINIIANLAFHKAFELKDINKIGIQAIEHQDLLYAKDLGYNIKLLGIAKKISNEFLITVQPTMISNESILSNVDGVYNAALINSNFLGNALLYGQGAGKNPTAMSIMSDLASITSKKIIFDKLNTHKSELRNNLPKLKKSNIINYATLIYKHYIRLIIQNKTSELDKVLALFEKQKITIQKLVKKYPISDKKEIMHLIIITEEKTNAEIKKLLQAIIKIKSSGKIASHIRIEDIN